MFRGTSIEFRAASRIEAGTEVTISYIDLACTRAVRRCVAGCAPGWLARWPYLVLSASQETERAQPYLGDGAFCQEGTTGVGGREGSPQAR